jgi:DNA-directed RNA polymerase specialized sigma24 family protein
MKAQTFIAEKRENNREAAHAGRQKWPLTQTAFDGLLACLDSDRDIAADRYLRIRRDLVRLFGWRGCHTPDDYADETMNRCARKIAQGEEIRDLAGYSIGVARMLLREMRRDSSRQACSLDETLEPCGWPAVGSDLEHRVEALRLSLEELSHDDRFLILNYYEGDKSEKIKTRKMLSELFGIGPSTLRMRAMRIREKLQLCTQNYLQAQAPNWVVTNSGSSGGSGCC